MRDTDFAKIDREEDLFPKCIAAWVERPYGILFCNEENKDSYDSNHALIFRDKEADPEQTLEWVQCKVVRFHDLRHTFATMALGHGMDVKTLSTIIGHVSSANTLDIYSHVTDTMQKQKMQQQSQSEMVMQ